MINKILVAVAFVVFVLATFGVVFSHVALIPLGLALYTLNKLI